MRPLGRRPAVEIVAMVIAIVAAVTAVHAQTPSRLPLIAILEPGPASPPSPVLIWIRDALAKLDWVADRVIQ